MADVREPIDASTHRPEDSVIRRLASRMAEKVADPEDSVIRRAVRRLVEEVVVVLRGSGGNPASDSPRRRIEASTGEDEDVLHVDEAARLLRSSKWTVYDGVCRGELPHRRIGKRILFSRRALLLWLQGADPRSAGKDK